MQPTLPATGRRAPRLGNIGHITRISNKLVQLGNNDNCIRAHLEVRQISFCCLISFSKPRSWVFLWINYYWSFNVKIYCVSFKITFFLETSWGPLKNFNKQLLAFRCSRNSKKKLCTETWFLFDKFGYCIDIYSAVHGIRNSLNDLLRKNSFSWINNRSSCGQSLFWDGLRYWYAESLGVW